MWNRREPDDSWKIKEREGQKAELLANPFDDWCNSRANSLYQSLIIDSVMESRRYFVSVPVEVHKTTCFTAIDKEIIRLGERVSSTLYRERMVHILGCRYMWLKIEFIEKERYYDDSAFTGQCWMYPTFMVKDGIEYFMWNRREQTSGIL